MNKKCFAISILFLLLTCCILVPIVFADTESLYVDGFNSVLEEWDETGATPWLNDNTGNYISTSVDEEWHEEFAFADSGSEGIETINSVVFYIELTGPSARNDFVLCYLHDGTDWVQVLSQDPDNDAYGWFNVDVSTTLDSWTKIDGAKLKIQYQRSGSPSTETIYARRSYLYVDYTLAGSEEYFYGSINEVSTIDKTRTWSFTKEGIIYQVSTINSWVESLVEFDVYGNVQPVVTVASSLEYAFVKYGDLTIVCQVVYSTSTEFNVFLFINPTFVVLGHYSEEAENIEYFYGLISETFDATSFDLWSINATGTLNQTITIATLKDTSINELISILQQMGINSITHEDFTSIGTINETLSIIKDKSVAFDLFQNVNQSFTIQSTFESLWGTTVTVFSKILHILRIRSVNDLPAPEVSTFSYPTTNGILFVMVIVGFGSAFIVYKQKRKKEQQII